MTAADNHEIRSTSNPTVRRLARMRDNRFRRRSGRILVDGWRECRCAITGGLQLCGLYVVDTPDEFHDVIEHARQTKTLQQVTNEVLQKIGYGQSSRGVVAEFQEPERSLEMLSLPDTPLILVLDKIEKPGNVGSVFRCADAAGVNAVILSDACDLFNPNAIRSSLGAVFRVPSAVASADQTLDFFVKRGIRVLTARVESSIGLWETDFLGPLAIVLGSEAEGLADRWQTAGEKPIVGLRIPMLGAVDSLNVAVSAAVIAYEALRVRTDRTANAVKLER